LADFSTLAAGPACTAAFTAIPRWSNADATPSANRVPPTALRRRQAGCPR
jgi:hypothetical protein